VPNRVVKEALIARAIPELAAYGTVRPEVKYGARSRVDFLLSGTGLPDAYVEVKNVHLLRTGDLAEFPDCVTDRGARHLAELSAMVAAGHRAVMLFLVQRTDCARFALAATLTPPMRAPCGGDRRRGGNDRPRHGDLARGCDAPSSVTLRDWRSGAGWPI
jgi:sugar fermentation stimulation protein A